MEDSHYNAPPVILPDTLSDAEYVTIDCETTGLGQLAEVIEVAALRCRGGRIVDRYVSLIRPEGPITPRASALHGLHLDHVKDAPPKSVVYGWLQDFIRPGDLLVSHYAKFDSAHLPVIAHHAWVCSWRLARHLWPNAPAGHSNAALGSWLRVDRRLGSAGRLHRAEFDAQITSLIFHRELLAYQGIQPYAGVRDLIRFASSPIDITTFGYGRKWRGMQIREISTEDLSWILADQQKPELERRMPEIDDDTLLAIRREIEIRFRRAA